MNRIEIGEGAFITLVFDGRKSARDPNRGNLIGLYYIPPEGGYTAYAVATASTPLSQGDWGHFETEEAAVRWLTTGEETQGSVENDCLEWRLIATDPPPTDGQYILLAGPSGYIGTSLRVEVCRYDAEYRPLEPWVNYSNDSFLDGGSAPTHWLPLPRIPHTGGGTR